MGLSIRGRTGSYLFFLLIILCSIGGIAGTKKQTKGEDQLQVKLDVPQDVVIGKAFDFKVIVTHPEGYHVFLQPTTRIGPLVVLGQPKYIQKKTKNKVMDQYVFKVFATKLGELTIKDLEIPYTNPAGEPMIRTVKFKINVKGELGNETSIKIREVHDLMPIYVRNKTLITVLIALGVALLAAILGAVGYSMYSRWKQAHTPPPPPIPPYEEAMNRIKELKNNVKLTEKNAKLVAFEISEIVRRYLGRVFDFPGVEMTSFEVLRTLKGLQLKVPYIEIEDFFNRLDMVKFANYKVADAQVRAFVEQGERIINEVHKHHETTESVATTD